MKRARKIAPAAPAPAPFLAAAIAQPQDCVGMIAQKAAEPPRNRVAELAKAEAFYLSLEDLRELPIHIDWDAVYVFKKALAAAITEMRLRP